MPAGTAWSGLVGSVGSSLGQLYPDGATSFGVSGWNSDRQVLDLVPPHPELAEAAAVHRHPDLLSIGAPIFRPPDPGGAILR